MTVPFDTQKFLEAVGPTFRITHNDVMVRPKTRASAICGDAREQAYMMAGVAVNAAPSSGSRSSLDHVLTAEQGRHMEDLSVAVIENMGFHIYGRQIELPPDYPVTGHPDGEFFDELGEIHGFEHKHPGRWGFIQILEKGGIRDSHPDWLMQATLYGHALNWRRCTFVVVAQDGSGILTEARRNLTYKNPQSRWGHLVDDLGTSKVWVETIDLEPYYSSWLPMALTRAEWFMDWAKNSGDPTQVAIEHDPEVLDKYGRRVFPWAYSAYLDRVLADGQSGMRAPALPFTGTFALDG